MNIQRNLAKKLAIKIVWFAALSLPIILFLLPFSLNQNGVLIGDWDYFAQLYEAMRRTILEFHQFPWWNPWTAGGVPLYANPQFGLISIQTPLVLIFGTLAGLHMAVLVYFLVGFWGMRTLLGRIGADTLVATLLSYIWVFSSFPVWHLAGGHLTFGTYFLAPWFFYFLLNIRKPRGWIYLGIFTAFLINQSVHYMTVHMLLIGSAVAMYQLYVVRVKYHFSAWKLLKPYVLSAAIVLPLVAHKLYFTLQYLHDLPRIPPSESAVPINVITAALTFRGTDVLNPAAFYSGGFGWSEYAAYFGLLTLGLFAYIAIKAFEKPEKIKPVTIFILVGLLLIFLLSLGSFSTFSPFAIMKHFPIFNQMQVSARWLGWFVLGVIIFLAKLPRKKIIIIILVLSTLDVFQSSFEVINADHGSYRDSGATSRSFEQVGFYKATQREVTPLRLFQATHNNIGDIYGYEPVAGFGNLKNDGYAGLTNRCARCDFVITKNATTTYWSPSLIKLHRTGPGVIKINENPGSYWSVNGVQIFRYMKVVELKQDFAINDPSEEITIEATPQLLRR